MQKQFYPAEIIEFSKESLIESNSRKSAVIYLILLLLFGGTIVSLPFIKIDVTVRAQGLIRPDTAIVGESGSGKSTLVSLLQNIYPIENIAVGDLTPDIKRITDVCESLGLTKFIESLPASYNTYLGENGAALSGGQKQRIAIARALYQEPEILILDEATSSLDSISEKFVQTTIEYLRNRNKTIIVIAHRLSTVMKADKIIVLDKGNIVEEGSHLELLNQKSYYFNLWKQQIPSLDSIRSLLE